MFLDKSPEERCNIFLQNLQPTNRGFNYYVDWTNVCGFEDLMVEINAIDTLIGCEENQFSNRFKELLTKLPSTVTLFPFLFGLAKNERQSLNSGNSSLTVLTDAIECSEYLEYKFPKEVGNLSDSEIEHFYDFFVKMGLKHLFQHIIEKSTMDYIVGVLVGLDSNGRKNRGGIAFELACQPILARVCQKKGLTLICQKKFKRMSKFGFSINEDIEERKADFIIINERQKKAINIEVNFFNGTGSKPEEIIDSYINRQNDLGKIGIEFALVTDGNCWLKANSQLKKGFRYIPFLQNFYMLKNGMIEEVLTRTMQG